MQARHRGTRVLALSFAASMVVHAIVLFGFSGTGRRDAPPIAPIAVTLSGTEPARLAQPPATTPEIKPQPEVEARRPQPAAQAGLSPRAPAPLLLELSQTPLAQMPARQANADY